MVKTLVIAGTQSGVGKTTLVVGLIAALRRRGLTVQPFKVGPDYLDPTHHARAAARPCPNLDAWLLPPERLRALFDRATADANFALVEGVMGLYDGLGYADDTASTAAVAKLLDAPVVLVVDAGRMARSAAAQVLGYQQFDRDLKLAGVILNRVGSASHAAGVAAAIAQTTGLAVFGAIPREDRLHLPERHLGLVPTAEPGPWDETAAAAGAVVAQRLDLDRLLASAPACGFANSKSPGTVRSSTSPRPVLAVARDEAFQFHYAENLALLEDAGAALAYFSPLRDRALPPRAAGILLSGGFPEVHAADLAGNVAMHRALRDAHERGLPIYAECGGLMYLTEALVDFAGQRYPMVGLLPGRAVMTRRLTLGYRLARPASPSWLLPEPDELRGHEFHYSRWEGRPAELPPAYLVRSPSSDGEARPEGAHLGNLLASYVHLHFWGKPELATRFVAACRRGPEA